nr:LysR substrate-binding domain-containing protein [Solirhodobacter olei]
MSQEADVALRMVAPRQGALVAKKVSPVAIGLYAALDYLDRRGNPATIEDLADHDLIGSDRGRADLALAEPLGPSFARERFALATDSHPAQVAAARAGVGIAPVQVPIG